MFQIEENPVPFKFMDDLSVKVLFSCHQKEYETYKTIPENGRTRKLVWNYLQNFNSNTTSLSRRRNFFMFQIIYMHGDSFYCQCWGLEDFGLATENFGSHSLRLRTLLTAPKFVHCHGSHWRMRRAEISLYYIYNIVYPLGMALREKNVDSEMRTKKNKRRWIKLEDKNKNKNYWMSWRQWKKSYINTRRNITGKKNTRITHVFFFFHCPYYNRAWVRRPRNPPESRTRGYGRGIGLSE